MLEHEVFCVVFLDAQHRVIELQQMFRGTVTQTSVYPREVVKEPALNAAAVILAHNHPSGAAEPSRADEYLTQTLKTALQLVDVRVLDHLVVTANVVVSFAERGLSDTRASGRPRRRPFSLACGGAVGWHPPGQPRPEVRRCAAVDRSPCRFARVASAVESRSLRPMARRARWSICSCRSVP
jgi:hypothetical protein